MEVWLVRHGVTAYNQNGVWQGQRDIPLAPEGRRQAELLALRLERLGETFTALYTSDLSRAAETARILGRRLGLEPRTDRRLREVCVGELSGLDRETVRRNYPEYLESSRRDPWHTRFPGGESLAELAERIADFLDGLGSGRYLVVTHGGAIRAAVLRALAADTPEPWRIRLENTSLTRLYYPEGPRAGGYVHAVGDAAHLEPGFVAEG
ncbi:histidine phosphatase family protein [Oceanithermus sp.]